MSKEAFTDDDRMPFGKFKGTFMGAVPASYLMWLWEQTWLADSHYPVYLYIHDNLTHLKREAEKEEREDRMWDDVDYPDWW